MSVSQLVNGPPNQCTSSCTDCRGDRDANLTKNSVGVLDIVVGEKPRNSTAGHRTRQDVRCARWSGREVNPGGRIYVWSDMFDPHHNAHKDYYLVRGDLKGSWEGLDKEIVVIPWYLEKRVDSLKWFAERGHRQVIAGYYDHRPDQVLHWLEAAKYTKGLTGVMYTTWQNKYSDLERFAQLVRDRK